MNLQGQGTYFGSRGDRRGDCGEEDGFGSVFDDPSHLKLVVLLRELYEFQGEVFDIDCLAVCMMRMSKPQRKCPVLMLF